MALLLHTVYALAATFWVNTGFFSTGKKQPGIKPPVTIVTDNSWEVSGRQTGFGEYPLSAQQITPATVSLYGGTYKAVAAESYSPSTIIPGTVPIWRNRAADSKMEAYQFRKTVQLGTNPIQKITLEVNCDDVARFYINKRLVTADKRDESINDVHGDMFLFRSITGFMYDRTYTYDVTDYFFTNVNNTILAEAASVAFDDGHAYISAKFVIEFAPEPQPPAAAPAKRQPAAVPKAKVPTPAPTTTVAQPGGAPEKTVFEAGRDPEIEKLHVGSILELGQVSFKADDFRLDSASYRTLAALATFMKRHPGLKIEVGGHTNLRASDSFAVELSANRARAVMRYLTDNGVGADRVTYTGYGKSQPRINAISKAADAANQRVEVKVLGR